MAKQTQGRKATGTGESRPGYIVGLPEDDPESELAQKKFESIVSRLQKAYPGLREARATVKTDAGKHERKRFEVEVFIFTGRDRMNFKEEGWSLATVFDQVTSRLKRVMTKTETKPAYQRHKTRGERETSNPEELGLGG